MAESPRYKLRQLENDCRRQIHNVIFDINSTAEREVREANYLCLALIHALPTTPRTDIIRAKNETVLRLQMHAKVANSHFPCF